MISRVHTSTFPVPAVLGLICLITNIHTSVVVMDDRIRTMLHRFTKLLCAFGQPDGCDDQEAINGTIEGSLRFALKRC
jgi:hypothetical protein